METLTMPLDSPAAAAAATAATAATAAAATAAAAAADQSLTAEDMPLAETVADEIAQAARSAVSGQAEGLTVAAAELENASPQEVLQWAHDRFGDGLALACSFSVEDVVLIDMLCRLTDSPRVFALDTGRLNPETYQVWAQVEAKYGLKLEAYFPQAEAVEAMVGEKGINLFYESVDQRRLCCHVRKVEPLNRALANLEAWVTGLRREQAVTRVELPKVEYDEQHGGIAKLNPLADWTREQVAAYGQANGVPRNALYEQGYASIGCAPCTRAIKPGEQERAGRWWWERPETKECGLHA